MKKILTIIAASIAVFSCNTRSFEPRPTIALVHSIVKDSTGLAGLVSQAGKLGSNGSIAIIGEPSDAASLARLFLGADSVDNIDGRPVRDSLQDFAGEVFHVYLDVNSSPYIHFLPDSPDSLREAFVQDAMFAWDSTAFVSSIEGSEQLAKMRSKILVYTSPTFYGWGSFDVDTLQQIAGGECPVFEPVSVSISEAVKAGASGVAVWASREIRHAGVYEKAWGESGAPGRLVSITPDAALDPRTELRSLLRQYRTLNRRLDAIILSSYDMDIHAILSEIESIRNGITTEDMALARLLNPGLVIIDPGESLIAAVYGYLRENNLFTHRISRPILRFFETDQTISGESIIVYVQDIH